MAKKNVIILRKQNEQQTTGPGPEGSGPITRYKVRTRRGKTRHQTRLAQGKTREQGHQTRDGESTKHERHPNNRRTDGFMTTEGLTASQHILTR